VAPPASGDLRWRRAERVEPGSPSAGACGSERPDGSGGDSAPGPPCGLSPSPLVRSGSWCVTRIQRRLWFWVGAGPPSPTSRISSVASHPSSVIAACSWHLLAWRCAAIGGF
jgi:hypothetical protein